MQSAGLSIIGHMAAVQDQRGRHAIPSPAPAQRHHDIHDVSPACSFIEHYRDMAPRRL
jgi:hypothetical protein